MDILSRGWERVWPNGDNASGDLLNLMSVVSAPSQVTAHPEELAADWEHCLLRVGSEVFLPAEPMTPRNGSLPTAGAIAESYYQRSMETSTR